MTSKGLAYFLMDDGYYNKHKGIVVISTESFLESDVDLFMSVLVNKFGLGCRKEKQGNGFRVVIKKKLCIETSGNCFSSFSWFYDLQAGAIVSGKFVLVPMAWRLRGAILRSRGL